MVSTEALTQELKPIELCSTPTLLSVSSSWNLIGSGCAIAQDHMGENGEVLAGVDGDGLRKSLGDVGPPGSVSWDGCTPQSYSLDADADAIQIDG